jgi:hypothetical protein
MLLLRAREHIGLVACLPCRRFFLFFAWNSKWQMLFIEHVIRTQASLSCHEQHVLITMNGFLTGFYDAACLRWLQTMFWCWNKTHLTFAQKNDTQEMYHNCSKKKCTTMARSYYTSYITGPINFKCRFTFAIKNIVHHIQQCHQEHNESMFIYLVTESISTECVSKKTSWQILNYILDVQLKSVVAIYTLHRTYQHHLWYKYLLQGLYSAHMNSLSFGKPEVRQVKL